jgi:hypothetical protein
MRSSLILALSICALALSGCNTSRATITTVPAAAPPVATTSIVKPALIVQSLAYKSSLAPSAPIDATLLQALRDTGAFSAVYAPGSGHTAGPGDRTVEVRVTGKMNNHMGARIMKSVLIYATLYLASPFVDQRFTHTTTIEVVGVGSPLKATATSEIATDTMMLHDPRSKHVTECDTAAAKLIAPMIANAAR